MIYSQNSFFFLPIDFLINFREFLANCFWNRFFQSFIRNYKEEENKFK
jgi:hypothetical protein